MKAVLSLLGIAFIAAWLVLWLAVKVTFGAIHLLVVIGVILIVLAFVKAVWRTAFCARGEGRPTLCAGPGGRYRRG